MFQTIIKFFILLIILSIIALISCAPPKYTPSFRVEMKSLDLSPLKGRKIVIDPGHGGKSRGARSAYKINGRYVWEKDVVLSVSKRLKHLIDASPHLVCVLTREDDYYVSLGERVDFAQNLNADMFVSIHCNAGPGFKPTKARGIEFFCWSERGSRNEALRFLERLENDENVASPKERNNQILFTRLLRDSLTYQKEASYRLCEALDKEFRRYPYFQRYNRGIKEARFRVLANGGMPAVLIEIGFISNKYEARHLVDSHFKGIIARAIFNGINRYFASIDSNFVPRVYALK